MTSFDAGLGKVTGLYSSVEVQARIRELIKLAKEQVISRSTI